MKARTTSLVAALLFATQIAHAQSSIDHSRMKGTDPSPGVTTKLQRRA